MNDEPYRWLDEIQPPAGREDLVVLRGQGDGVDQVVLAVKHFQDKGLASQLKAVLVIQVPTREMSWPEKKSR